MSLFQPVSSFVTTYGSDHSVNSPLLQSNATTLVYNTVTYTLLTTIPANPARTNVTVRNTTGSIVVVALDGNTFIPLAASTGQYITGDIWSSDIEDGRVRVFGVAGTYLSARQISSSLAVNNASALVTMTAPRAVVVAADPT